MRKLQIHRNTKLALLPILCIGEIPVKTFNSTLLIDVTLSSTRESARLRNTYNCTDIIRILFITDDYTIKQ